MVEISTERPGPLVWVDIEATGLEVDERALIEIAVLISDGDLNEVAEGPNLVVHQEEAVLEAMDEWNTRQHGGSGLTAAVRASTVDLVEAEEIVLGFLQAHCEAGKSPLAGNSVHFDRAMLKRHMPRVEAHLHYRNVDVSTVKELVRRWYPEMPLPVKGETHRAMDDIRASLAELRYYRERVFRTSG
ncbi:MAG TPA: oligoribonuclease [Tepidiformaceae bacterium]|nr:oligoribonuclease [Tepidiformaceae bacterium]